ncbi:MAG: glycosyltransferase family 2 protein [Bacteroidia bacterium]|nr:glycosyltransferase family 2 protein [Bacteroidia bacterium]
MTILSIIIINYNTYKLTCNCITSIIEKTRNIKYEIILVDNASTECTPDKFKEKFATITLIRNNENRGFAVGCNDGIRLAQGKYILLLNSDTILLNNAAAICTDFLDKHPKTGVVTCRLENQDSSPQHNCQAFPSIKLMIAEKFRLHKFFPAALRAKIWLGLYFNYTKMSYVDWVWGTYFMFRREILSGFYENKLPEDFFMYIEDMQWCLEFKKSGYKIAFFPEARVLHLGAKFNPKSQRMIVENQIRFVKENYPFWKAKTILFLNFLFKRLSPIEN